ncbi:MAG: carbohydrate kinase family protein [Cyanobacteria bacterium SZAS-4]|nr:carbohydrate kinase family protein [Cyanobacteria bacterium SZAS-4]
MSSILVIGCASLDTIHVEKNGSRTTYETIGGAGLYTALAARMSIPVTLYAPKPHPMPRALELVEQLLDWQGPTCHPDAVPRLEIVHHGGGKATLLNASWGAESMLTPEQLPTLDNTSIVHIAALSSANSQYAFLTRCRQQQGVAVSVGTYAKLVYQSTAEVRELFDASDYFFMNDNEARGLFQAGELETPRKRPRFFVTDGENGATVYDGSQQFKIPASPIAELDPTGAGDTFCGATLAHILHNMPIQEAAEVACDLASQNVAHIGPSYILENLQHKSKSR